jgi:hypothetical protein
MGKVVAANEACKIGSDYREKRKEETFLSIMDRIASAAKYSNELKIAERVNGSQVYDSDLVNYLVANPDQVDRLQNMGYAVEQSVDEVPTSWTEDEAYTVRRGPFGWFGPSTQHRQVRRESTIEVRSFTISWECEECDGRDEETI